MQKDTDRTDASTPEQRVVVYQAVVLIPALVMLPLMTAALFSAWATRRYGSQEPMFAVLLGLMVGLVAAIGLYAVVKLLWRHRRDRAALVIVLVVVLIDASPWVM